MNGIIIMDDYRRHKKVNQEIMKKMGFEKEVNAVIKKQCPFCGKPVKLEDFTDRLSKREFQISGICQKCQDKTFG